MKNSAEAIYAEPDRSATNAWLIALIAWFAPGAGHFLQGLWVRGALGCSAVCIMFATGIVLGGHLYSIGGQEKPMGSALLQLPPMIASGGAGVLYLICWLTNTGFTEHAERATFEYGNTFLWVAGLLNYLLMLDAFDLAVKRKP